MSYAAAVTSLANATLEVTRRAEPVAVRVAGRVQPPVTSTFSIRASLQTPTGKDLERLPEGRWTSDMRVVYTLTALILGGPGTGFLCDVVTIEGSPFEVQHVEPWDSLGGSFWRAVCLRSREVV